MTDWRAAADRGGTAVLGSSRELLVSVGGRDFQATLRGVRTRPSGPPVPGRLVYAVHDYRWYHSPLGHHLFFTLGLWFRFGYVHTPGIRFTAPVYLSETGTCTDPNPTERCHALHARFLRHIGRYLAHTDMDFAHGPFNGTQGAGYSRTYGAPGTYGLLATELVRRRQRGRAGGAAAAAKARRATVGRRPRSTTAHPETSSLIATTRR